MFRLWSVNNIVILAAKPGSDNSNGTARSRPDQTNKSVWYWYKAGAFIIIVVIKLIATLIEDTLLNVEKNG